MSEIDYIPFWESKSLHEMTRIEWESLCDGCGKCCLNKVVDDYSEELLPTTVACSLLDHQTGRCQNYKHRRKLVPDCMKFTPKTLHEFLPWLPQECAYKCLLNNQPLPEWHPLITGDSTSVKQSGQSVQTMDLISEDDLGDSSEWYNYIIRV